MIALTLCVLLLALIAVGLGALAERALTGRDAARLNFAEKGILGLLAAGAAGLVLNFFLPLDWRVTSALALAGLAGIGFCRREVAAALGGRPRRVVLLFVLFGVAVAAGAFNAPLHPDTGLYHFQTVLWQHVAPLPLGVANLHFKLAFNQLWFTVASALWLPAFEVTAVFAVNAVIAVFVLLGLAQRALDEEVPERHSYSTLYALLALAVLALTVFRGTGSPNTDYPAAWLNIYAFYLGARMLESAAAGDRRAQAWERDYVLLAALVLLAFTTKLSQLPLALLPALVVTGMHRGRVPRFPLLRVHAAAAALLVLWALRGLGLSGCALFPHPATCVPGLAWAVSGSEAARYTEMIRAWGRGITSGVMPPDWSWLPAWLGHMYQYKLVWLLQLLCAGGIAILAAKKIYLRLVPPRHRALHAEPQLPAAHFAALWSVALAGLAFWFFAAPDVRFGYGYLVSAPLTLLAYTLHRASTPRVTPARAAAVIWTAAVFMLAHAAYQTREAGPEALALPWPRIELRANRVAYTHEGRPVYLSDERNECWWQLPCTPRFDPRLRITSLGIWPMFQGAHGDPR